MIHLYQKPLKLKMNNNITVKKTGSQGSGILRSMSDANCFIVLPLNSNDIKPGDLVDVQIFDGII